VTEEGEPEGQLDWPLIDGRLLLDAHSPEHEKRVRKLQELSADFPIGPWYYSFAIWRRSTEGFGVES
jgi:hypothetical protein